MDAPPTTCPTPELLQSYGLGELDDASAEAMMQHLEHCARCQQQIVELPDDDFLQRLRAAQNAGVSPSAPTPAPSGRRPAPLAAPASVPSGLPPELAEHPKFRIVRELGRGGMGVVYQAEHRLMDRLVAIKLMNRTLIENPDALDRFRREVKAAALLDHRNIVRAYDAEQAGDLHLLVMEYIEGVSLAELVAKRSRLPVFHACHYVRQAALGLQHAFERQMVHRDIKPQNLMLTREGRIKILDFGLARLVSEQAQGHHLTQANAVMGTPAYMAPEQGTDARNADIRADIYSLGCTFYCLLSGEPPFAGGSWEHMIFAHKHVEARRLQEVFPDVPPELSVVVAKMMAKEPDQRYQTPAEVAKALALFAKPGGQPLADSGPLQMPTDTAQLRPVAQAPQVSFPLSPATRGDESRAPGSATLARGNVRGSPQRMPSGYPPRPVSKLIASRPWVRLAAALGVGFAGLIGVFAAVVIWWTTPDGVLVFEVDEEAREVEPAWPDEKVDEIPKQSQADVFVPLFNGRDLTGWGWGKDKPLLWGIENGVLFNTGGPTFLRNNTKSFKSFHLRIDATMNEVGQSKLVVRNRVLSIGKWRHWGGYSIYLDHDAVSDQRMGSIGIHRVNAPNPIVQPAKRVACKPLEPFRLEVIAEGNQLISRVNGETVADWRDPRDWFKNGRVNIIITHPGTQLKISKIEVKGVAVSAPKEEMEEGDPMQ